MCVYVRRQGIITPDKATNTALRFILATSEGRNTLPLLRPEEVAMGRGRDPGSPSSPPSPQLAPVVAAVGDRGPRPCPSARQSLRLNIYRGPRPCLLNPGAPPACRLCPVWSPSAGRGGSGGLGSVPGVPCPSTKWAGFTKVGCTPRKVSPGHCIRCPVL